MTAVPDATETSLTVLELAQASRFDEIRALFAPHLQSIVPAEALRMAWEGELARLGSVSGVGTPRSEPGPAGTVVVRLPVTCERGAATLVTALNDAGQLVGLQLAPPAASKPTATWEPPAYAAPERFDEHDVTLGPDPLAVPGTLSLPRGSGPFPAVVLLAGSGSSDRDGTLGPNRPLKDLAWGLASRGIAVVRFDKVTHTHPDAVRADDAFTVTDEYIPHAIAAVELLREHAAVDPARVFVAGHSLGGTVAPRIAAAEPSIAGLVIMAGGTQPLHWAMVRQHRYLASLNPDTAAAAQPLLDALEEQARLVDSPELSLATPASGLPFGVPAAYWLDLRAYRPTETAAALAKPMLVVQAGRDYQTTVDDDLAGWRHSLGDRQDVTIRVYPDDNHLFFPGTGRSTPAEYEPAQHVDPEVVVDIARWVGVARPSGT